MSSNIDKKTQAEADKTANPAVLAVIGLAPEQTKSVKPERNVLMHIAVIFGYNFMKKCFCSYNRVRNGAINARGSV